MARLNREHNTDQQHTLSNTHTDKQQQTTNDAPMESMYESHLHSLMSTQAQRNTKLEHSTGHTDTADDTYTRYIHRLYDSSDSHSSASDAAAGAGADADADAGDVLRSSYVLSIDLSSVRFTDHRYFSVEDDLCAQLSTMVAEWHRRQAVKVIEYHRESIVGYRQQMTNIKEQIFTTNTTRTTTRTTSRTATTAEEQTNIPRAGSDTNTASLVVALCRLLSECAEHRLLIDEEEWAQRQLFAHIYEIWNKIKEWRKKTKTHSSSSSVTQQV